MTNTEIAKTILDQLGGNRFIAFTGSKNFMAIENGLQMTLAKNGSKANRLEITLTCMDTYNMRFYKHTNASFNMNRYIKTGDGWRDAKDTEIKTFKGVYFDQLQELFTETTKLYTHF